MCRIAISRKGGEYGSDAISSAMIYPRFHWSLPHNTARRRFCIEDMAIKGESPAK